MREIGSLANRLEENRYFNGTKNNIKVGTKCTIYLYSDSHAYEVVEVENQQNVTIRRLKAIRTDNYGMSDTQDYRYESDENAGKEKIRLTKNGWREVKVYTKEGFEKAVENFFSSSCKTIESARAFIEYHYRLALTEKEFQKVMAGKSVTKVKGKVNISFGVANEYFDYSF